jgi:dihydroorotate dehydrogenase electron transfer subunit
VALVALGETVARLKPLLTIALEQNAAVVLVSDLNLFDLPSEVEIQPLSGLEEIIRWADFLAIDIPRESLAGLREKLGINGQSKVAFEAQVLLHSPMPCGGIAECGVCSVPVRRGWKMACKDGPVFDLRELV